MTSSKVVVIGASAGGVDALIELVKDLPVDFGAPILVVLHIPVDSPSLLAKILGRAKTVKTKTAEHGDKAENGMLYVAPPDRHLTIGEDGVLHVIRGPRENRHRPAVDPLFRSAALHFAENAIGVILSGTLDDGTAGLIAVKQRGGLAIVQDPDDAMYPGMPQSALAQVDADYVLPLSAIAHQLTLSIQEERRPDGHGADIGRMAMEHKISEMDRDAYVADDRPGQPSAFSCPDCGGVLWEIEDGAMARFRCRVGHAMSPETMLGAQAEKLEEALWSAMKTLEESARLAARLADTERSRGHEWLVKRFESREQEARERADIIRRFLLTSDGTVPIGATAARPS